MFLNKIALWLDKVAGVEKSTSLKDFEDHINTLQGLAKQRSLARNIRMPIKVDEIITYMSNRNVNLKTLISISDSFSEDSYINSAGDLVLVCKHGGIITLSANGAWMFEEKINE